MDWFVVFRMGGSFKCYNVADLQRGLFDWSGGREVLAGLRREFSTDVWTCQMTDEQAYAVNNDGAQPPWPKIVL